MPYWVRFVQRLTKDSVPWARDNILFAGAMAIIPAIIAYIFDRAHVVDWPVIRLTLWMYLATLLVYVSYHSLRTVQKLDAEHLTEIERLQERLQVGVLVTGLEPNDPVIEPTFFDGRRSIEGVASLELKNSGDAVAYDIRLAPVKLTKRTVYFPRLSESIHPTDFEHFYADVGDQWGPDRKQDLIRAMSEEWTTHEDHATRREILVPARIDFENGEGVRFECNFELLYHGGRGWNQPPGFNCIECRNLSYRRIPPGITPPLASE
jgi:hypothetical protein